MHLSRFVVATSSLLATFTFCPVVTGLSSGSSSTMNNKNAVRNVVVIGGGIQGAAVAFHVAQKSGDNSCRVTVLEAVRPAAAASGKGGGFMARSWGDGSPTQRLHELAFDLYQELCAGTQLNCASYRKLPVLSVSPSGRSGLAQARKDQGLAEIVPAWLDGTNVGRIRAMGQGEDTAQVTPSEVVEKMLAAYPDSIKTVIGKCVGIETTDQGSSSGGGSHKVTGVKYQVSSTDSNDSGNAETRILAADAVVVCAGPWSCAAEDWFEQAAGIQLQLPMEGIKSTSIVWKKPDDVDAVDATALFCGEDDRYGTHLEVYPRLDGTIYICGIGGSDYVKKDALKEGAFLTECNANEARVQAAMASFQDMSSVYEKRGELDRSQACMRPCPPDAMPYMGAIPGCEGAYINAGHNCWGIAWAPACGLAMAELILDGECTSVDLSPFDPARFTPKATKRGRKQQGVDVGEQW